MEEQNETLETYLNRVESGAIDLLKTVRNLFDLVKKCRHAAQVGDLRELRNTIDTAEQVITTVKQQCANAKESWDFDEASYLSSGAFRAEIVEAGKRDSVDVFEQDGRLYCYPSLIQVLPSERAVLIGKIKERRLRPSLLIKQLKDSQRKPSRFKPEGFLESLYWAYKNAVGVRRENDEAANVVIPLSEIYDLLTPLPWQAKEYTKHEFARDMYLLDQSGITKTKDEMVVYFPASTGTKLADSTLTVITQNGHEKKYYGISFRKLQENSSCP